jgi:hypothetical protein
MNDGLFTLIVTAMGGLIEVVGGDGERAQMATRILVAAAVGSAALWASWRPIRSSMDLCQRCLAVLAAMFLLGPTQYPWYSIWMLPFLAVSPRLPLLLLSALLPLYYLRFPFKDRGLEAWFDYGVVWLEYLPVWVVLAWEGRRALRTGADAEAVVGTR